VLVVVSSLAAGGPAPGGRPRREDDASAPVSLYGRVKRDAERAARVYADRVPLTIVRPPMVFGDGDASALKLYRLAERGLNLVPGTGPKRLSSIHAVELARALVDAGRRGERAATPDGPEARGLYYVAHREITTYAELGDRVARSIGRAKTLRLHVPAVITWAAAAIAELFARLGDRPSLLNLDKLRDASAGEWTCAIDKAERELGFAPGPLDDALAETARAYRARGLLRA
ncbi:sugar nucleotide-binding protein, partial [Myxococcota bacterium]|nr:sugar nucleotide-binding protein [Myxococcota bacterium]